MRVGFADQLKVQYATANNMTLEELEEAKNKFESVRRALIEFGHEMRRWDPHYWVKRVLTMPGDLIIPDLRFMNELLYTKDFPGSKVFTLRVNSSREKRSTRGTLTNENDISETELDFYNDWDFEIENNEGLQEFMKECDYVAEHLIPHLNQSIL